MGVARGISEMRSDVMMFRARSVTEAKKEAKASGMMAMGDKRFVYVVVQAAALLRLAKGYAGPRVASPRGSELKA